MSIAIWLAFGDRPPRAAASPQDQLIATFESAGFKLIEAREILGGARHYTFKASNCDAPAEVLLIESVHRDAAEAIAAALPRNTDPLFVYGGQIVAGLGPSALMPRWIIRKFRAAFNVAAASPWDSMAVAAFFPRACPAPVMDWRGLK